jgi:hypothetical protein
MHCMIRHGWIMGIPQDFLCLFVRLLLFQDCPCSRLFRSLRCQMLNTKYSSCNLTSVSAYRYLSCCWTGATSPATGAIHRFCDLHWFPSAGVPVSHHLSNPTSSSSSPFSAGLTLLTQMRCSARLALPFRLCTPIIDIFFRAAQPPCILAFDLRSNDDDILVPTGPIVAPVIHNTSQAFSKLSFSVIRWPKAQPARELEPLSPNSQAAAC